jgi:hypothetical protein
LVVFEHAQCLALGVPFDRVEHPVLPAIFVHDVLLKGGAVGGLAEAWKWRIGRGRRKRLSISVRSAVQCLAHGSQSMTQSSPPTRSSTRPPLDGHEPHPS